MYPDLDVNVLMMLTKWYITPFYKHLENKINHFFVYSISACNVILQSALRMIFLAN